MNRRVFLGGIVAAGLSLPALPVLATPTPTRTIRFYFRGKLVHTCFDFDGSWRGVVADRIEVENHPKEGIFWNHLLPMAEEVFTGVKHHKAIVWNEIVFTYERLAGGGVCLTSLPKADDRSISTRLARSVSQ